MDVVSSSMRTPPLLLAGLNIRRALGPSGHLLQQKSWGWVIRSSEAGALARGADPHWGLEEAAQSW